MNTGFSKRLTSSQEKLYHSAFQRMSRKEKPASDNGRMASSPTILLHLDDRLLANEE